MTRPLCITHLVGFGNEVGDGRQCHHFDDVDISRMEKKRMWEIIRGLQKTKDKGHVGYLQKSSWN
jgi:hypothetical protein